MASQPDGLPGKDPMPVEPLPPTPTRPYSVVAICSEAGSLRGGGGGGGGAATRRGSVAGRGVRRGGAGRARIGGIEGRRSGRCWRRWSGCSTRPRPPAPDDAQQAPGIRMFDVALFRGGREDRRASLPWVCVAALGSPAPAKAGLRSAGPVAGGPMPTVTWML